MCIENRLTKVFLTNLRIVETDSLYTEKIKYSLSNRLAVGQTSGTVFEQISPYPSDRPVVVVPKNLSTPYPTLSVSPAL